MRDDKPTGFCRDCGCDPAETSDGRHRCYRGMGSYAPETDQPRPAIPEDIANVIETLRRTFPVPESVCNTHGWFLGIFDAATGKLIIADKGIEDVG